MAIVNNNNVVIVKGVGLGTHYALERALDSETVSMPVRG